MTEHNRRLTDTGMHRNTEIDKLILEEDDSKQRAFLIVLNNINNSLIENTRTTKEIAQRLDEHITTFKAHREEFSAHATKEDALINQGRGAWKGLSFAWKLTAWVLGVAQTAIIAICVYASNDLKDIHAYLDKDAVMHAALEVRVSNLEKGDAP